MVHEAIGCAFEILTMAFSGVLTLMVWFGLPIFDEQMVQNVMNLATDLNLGMVTDQFGGHATHANDILKGVDKLLFCLHAKDIGDK